jgi:hypothetical protein
MINHIGVYNFFKHQAGFTSFKSFETGGLQVVNSVSFNSGEIVWAAFLCTRISPLYSTVKLIEPVLMPL